jgi:hypothetical protein
MVAARSLRNPSIGRGVMMRRIGYAVVAWAVPYVTAIPLMELLFRDRIAFETIMIVEGALVGSFLACQYFRAVQSRFLREGITLGAVWIATSWVLDFLALVPFADMPAWRYFVEIGFRYLAMFAPTIAIGYVLRDRLERQAAPPARVPKVA